MYINDLQKKGVCKVQHQSTDNIPSDALTKALGPTEFHKRIQVLLGQKQLTWTHTKANKPTAPSTTNKHQDGRQLISQSPAGLRGYVKGQARRTSLYGLLGKPTR
jgi:hypothetical protein